MAGFAVLAPGSLGQGATGGCVSAERLSCVGPRLPAPITIEAGYGPGSLGYRIGRDGRVHHARTNPQATQTASGSAPGVWWAIRHGHLVVGRGKAFWQSHGEGYSLLDVRMVQVDPRAITFSDGNALYLAPVGGAERLIARGEEPLGFTSGGLYTNQWGRRLLLRSDSGAIVKTIAIRPLQWDYFVVDGSLYFIAHGVLMRARGARVVPLVTLRRLGLSARSVAIQPVGSLLELEDQHRLVVLRPNGALFASTPLRGSVYRAENEVAFVAIAPSPTAVAFILQADQSSGAEIVYVLRPGADRAIPVHRQEVKLEGCAHGASLQWHGNWLLYSNTEEDLAAIETTGAHRAIDLGSFVWSLPVSQGGFTAAWS